MVAMNVQRTTIATLFVLLIMVASSANAQHTGSNYYPQSSPIVLSDQSTPPNYPTAFSVQDQIQGTNPQSPVAAAECQCPDCQAKKEKEEKEAAEARAAKQAKISAQMTGDWFGRRSCLEERGIDIQSSLTQFYQGVASGGGEQRFRYGDKMDVLLNADTGKLGLWEGGLLTSHVVDWQFGRSSIADAVGLAPVNTALLTPKIGEPAYAMTSLQYTQQLSNGWAATIGRVNLLDLWVGFYPEYGRGIDGFMNLSTMFHLNTIPSVPLVTNAAGFLKAGERGVEAGFVVMDSQHSPTTVGLDFPNGVTLLAIGRKYTDFGGLPGSHTLMGTYATGDYTSFNTQGWIVIPGGGVEPTEKSGTWHAAYFGEQRLWVDRCNDKRYTKLFGYVGFSDAETSPFALTASVTVESFGPVASRPSDRTGIAYFYNALNDDFQNVFSLVTPLADVHGGELYYNAEITPWFHLTFDLQVIDPAIEARDTAVVLGTRVSIDF